MEKFYGVLAVVSAVLTVLAAGSTGYGDASLAGGIMTAGFAIASKMGSK